jgi:hypothetical protein
MLAKSALIIGAIFNFVIALVHVVIVFIGPFGPNTPIPMTLRLFRLAQICY